MTSLDAALSTQPLLDSLLTSDRRDSPLSTCQRDVERPLRRNGRHPVDVSKERLTLTLPAGLGKATDDCDKSKESSGGGLLSTEDEFEGEPSRNDQRLWDASASSRLKHCKEARDAEVAEAPQHRFREKNRVAQRRFREKQRAKVETLEGCIKELQLFKEVACKKEAEYKEQLGAFSRQLVNLQVDRTRLQAREVRVIEIVHELAGLKALPGQVAEEVLDKFLLEMRNFRSGTAELDVDWLMTKLLLFLDPRDCCLMDEALITSLDGGKRISELCIHPSQLAIRLREPMEGSSRLCSIAELVHLPAEAFVSLYSQYTWKLSELAGSRPMCQALPQLDVELTSELRGLMCCFSAIYPTHSVQQQLMHSFTRDPVGDAVDLEVTRKLKAQVCLSEEQVRCLDQAVMCFQQQQQKLQLDRKSILRRLHAPFNRRSSAKIHEAETALRTNLEDDVSNVCRLTTHFISRVLRLDQYCRLVVAALPHNLHVVGLIHSLLDLDEPMLDPYYSGS